MIGSIVIRGTNWIGDAMMTIPAMREIGRVFPDAEIFLHTPAGAAGIFHGSDLINDIIPFQREKNRYREVRRQADILRRHHFDLAIIFPNSFESALTAKLAGIPRRIGFNKDLRGLLLTDPVAVPEWKGRRHEVFYYLALAAEAERRYAGTNTIAFAEPDESLEIAEERRQAARGLLAAGGVDLTRRTIALGVGSTNSMAKRWGAEKYAELNDYIQAELNANVILTGSPDEIDVAEKVRSLSEYPPLIFAGKTDIAMAAAVLAVVDMLVSNDMGTAHIAPAVGTPTIVIFGPTNDATTRPFSKNAVVIRRDVECAPCMLRECPLDHRCMTRISAREVFEEVKLLLAEKEALQ